MLNRFLKILCALFALTALSADEFVYVTNEDDRINPSVVSVVNTETNTIVATITVGTRPGGIALTPLGDRAYVANQVSQTVSVIATSSNEVIATVTVESGPTGVAITPDGNLAYVTNNTDGLGKTVNVIDTSSNEVIATVTVELKPNSVAITPNGNLAYVANNTVSVIDTATLSLTETIPGFHIPQFLAITPKPPKLITSGQTHYQRDLFPVDIINKITWEVPDIQPTSYKVYRDENLIARLGAESLEYLDHKRRPGKSSTYRVEAQQGFRTVASGTIRVQTPSKVPKN